MLIHPMFHHARTALPILALALPAHFLDTSCVVQCAAACSTSETLTIHGLAISEPADSVSFVLKVVAASFTATCTLDTTHTTSEPSFSCVGGALSVSFDGNEDVSALMFGTTESYDLTVTRNDQVVLNQHVDPTLGSSDVCGEQCTVGTATLTVP